MGILQGLVSNNGRLYAAWKGVPGNDSIFWSYWTGSGAWSPQAPAVGGTSVGPSLTVYNGLVYAAWKGVSADPRLFFSNFNGNVWGPQQMIPWAFSDQGPALGVLGSKLIAVWKNAWDQTLWWAQYDGHTWSAATVIPGVEWSVGVSLALYNGKLYAALRGVTGNEHLFYISFNGSTWSGQGGIPGTSIVGPSLAGVGANLYAVWRGADTDQALRWSFFNGTSWSPAALIPGGNSSEGAALSVFNGVLYAMWKGIAGDDTLWMSHLNGTTWAPVFQPGIGSTGQDEAPGGPWATSPSVLGSGSNYFLASSCANLGNVQIFIGITEDLVAAAPTGKNQQGFAFQLNCSSPIDSANPSNVNWIVWQQYIIGIGGTGIGCAINNWTTASFIPNQQTIDSPALQIATLARANVIPAGSTVSIELSFDASGNVSEVTSNLTPGGTAKPVPLIGLALTGGGKVTTANLAPIVAYELNLVGPGDTMHAHFTSGAGVIVYTGANALTPLASLNDVKAPGSQTSCVANLATTGETSNSTYGLMPVGPNNTMSQTFSVNTSVQ